MSRALKIVVLGLSLSSSWGNGHATTYRSLLRGLAKRGHDIVFLERSQPWYAEHRDLVAPDYCRLHFYDQVADLYRHEALLASADAVIVGSYVPDGIAAGMVVHGAVRGASAFYDIDTPVTLTALDRGTCSYLARSQVRAYDLYLSFTSGPILQTLEASYGARCARALLCSVDADRYQPVDIPARWDLGYLGTYSADRQPALEMLLNDVARRAPHLACVVAGPLYPDDIRWPDNVTRIDHVPPADHPKFYAECRYSLNLTRADMRAAGFSPSVRLFESAACGSAILSDPWPGLETVLQPGREIAVVTGTNDVLAAVQSWPEWRRRSQARAARERVLAAHTGDKRAEELEGYLFTALDQRRSDARANVRAPIPAHSGA